MNIGEVIKLKTLISFLAAICLSACSSFGEVSFNKQQQVKKREYDKIHANWKRDDLKKGDKIGELTPTMKTVTRIYPKNVNRSTRIVTPNERYNAD